MSKFASKTVNLNTNCSGFVKSINIPDEDLFSETSVGTLHTKSKLYDIPVGFVTSPAYLRQ